MARTSDLIEGCGVSSRGCRGRRSSAGFSSPGRFVRRKSHLAVLKLHYVRSLRPVVHRTSHLRCSNSGSRTSGAHAPAVPAIALRTVVARKRFAFSQTPFLSERRHSKTLRVFSNSGATHLRSPHPRPAVPLPDKPGVAASHLTVLMLRFCEPSHLADLRLCLPRAVDRLLLPADVTPAEFDLCSFERPVVEDSGQGLRLRRPSCLLQAIVVEVLPSTVFDRRGRPAGCRRGPGFVLLHREGME